MSARTHKLLCWIKKAFCRMQPRDNTPSLSLLARRYEDELADRTFYYTFIPENGKPIRADIEYERSGFCHLFSIGSLVKEFTSDTSEFSGMKGWNNIQNGKITFAKLAKLNPDEFAYYKQEYDMIDEMIETARNPQAVRYIKDRVSNSKLEADIMLYRIYGDKTVHIALSKGKDGWFVRSYFVRDNDRDRQYPTKYICGMPPLKVETAVKY